MPNEYARALGARLRAVRNQQGLSLQGVEAKSRGLWKAVVVGSYERGDRAVTVQRLAELAAFYGVPVAELLPGPAPAVIGESRPRLVIDLERLSQLPSDQAGPLTRYTAAIQLQRGDYNGRVLSIRQDDLRMLALIYEESPSVLAEQLIDWGVLNPARSAG
ncbi:MAG: transcriptional regulator [Candidatus Nanopelagicales bacterium]